MKKWKLTDLQGNVFLTLAQDKKEAVEEYKKAYNRAFSGVAEEIKEP